MLKIFAKNDKMFKSYSLCLFKTSKIKFCKRNARKGKIMENGMQETKTVSRKGMKNFFKSSIEKIKKFDKEMSDCTSISFPAFPFDLGMKITYNISKFIFKICFVLFMLQFVLWTIENFSGDYKEILNPSIGSSVQENKYLKFLEKLRKTNKNLKIDYNIQDFSKLGFLLQMEEMRKIKDLSSEKGTLESRCSSKKFIAISETVRCKLK